MCTSTKVTRCTNGLSIHMARLMFCWENLNFQGSQSHCPCRVPKIGCAVLLRLIRLIVKVISKISKGLIRFYAVQVLVFYCSDDVVFLKLGIV